MFGPVLAMAVVVGSAGHAIPVAPFHMVDLAARATVQVEQAPVTGVVVSGDPQLVRCVTADARDGKLVLGWAGRSQGGRPAPTKDGEIVVTARADCPHHGDPRHLTIRVTTPALDGVKISDQGVIHVAPMRTPVFAANIVERGIVTIDGLHANATTLSIGGIGHISATGELGKLATAIAGSGIIDTRAASATGIEVTIGGHGNIAATVNGPASGTLAGSGTIMIGGHPACTITKLGSGRIICPTIQS